MESQSKTLPWNALHTFCLSCLSWKPRAMLVCDLNAEFHGPVVVLYQAEEK